MIKDGVNLFLMSVYVLELFGFLYNANMAVITSMQAYSFVASLLKLDIYILEINVLHADTDHQIVNIVRPHSNRFVSRPLNCILFFKIENQYQKNGSRHASFTIFNDLSNKTKLILFRS